MLQQVLEDIHNYFIKKPNPGTYTIDNGVISPIPALKEGQRFWLVGSDLNDGVYTYHETGIRNDDDTAAAGLQDETWSGTVCALAVPPAVIALSAEIKSWVATYGEAVNSPYQSESVIGVYSYTLASGGKGANGETEPITWQSKFANQLNRWRRIAF